MSVAKERLYLTADDKVVPEGDPAAAFLLCTEGEEIPEGYSAPAAKAAPKAENKKAATPANKAKS